MQMFVKISEMLEILKIIFCLDVYNKYLLKLFYDEFFEDLYICILNHSENKLYIYIYIYIYRFCT